MALYLGIDPGAKGSLCLLDSITKDVKFLDTPPIHSALAIFTAINTFHNTYHIQHIAIEDVHAIFGTSAGSNFKFGFNTGVLHGIVGSTGIGFELVTPKVWQKDCGVRFKPKMKAADKKKVVAAICEQLYPSASIRGPKGGLLDGRSDALMIAHYLYIKYGVKNE